MGLAIIVTVFTGLVLFLFGIEHLSREIQNAVGEKFRRLLARATSNRVRGAFLGAGFTAIIQSAIATIVITTGLVNAGILSFTQSLGIIIGANVGTTLTAQLVAFNLMSFAPLFLILGFFLGFLGRGSYKLIGKSLFYFGLVFFSLNLMSEALIPLREIPEVMKWFTQLSNIFLVLLVGFLITVIVQSSSVTIGIAVILASSGMITLPQGIPLLLGAKIGSTLPVLINSWKLNLHAKRAAIAQLIFNFLGAMIVLPLIVPFSTLVQIIGGGIGQQVANAQLIISVGLAIIFLLALKPYEKLVIRIVPGKEKEILQKTKYLKSRLPEDNDQVIFSVEKEISYSLDTVWNMFKKTNQILSAPSEKELSIFQSYNSLHILLDKEIEESLLKLSKRKLSQNQSKKVVHLIRISNSIKQLGNTADSLSHLYKQVWDEKMHMSKQSQKDTNALISLLGRTINLTKRLLSNKKLKANGTHFHQKIRGLINKKYKEYFNRLQKNKEKGRSIFVKSTSMIEIGFLEIEEIVNLIKEYRKLG
ncbi:MAG: Na/Pi cotransporter family protein [archaeon]